MSQAKNNLVEDKKIAKKLIELEKKYEINSCELLSNFTFPTKEEKDFKDTVLEYIKRNLNPLKINSYKNTTYTLLNKEDYNKQGVLNFIFKTTPNDFLIVRNDINNYRDVLLTTNSMFRYTVLLTTNKSDYDIKLSNVCVIFTDDYEETLNNFKDKTLY